MRIRHRHAPSPAWGSTPPAAIDFGRSHHLPGRPGNDAQWLRKTQVFTLIPGFSRRGRGGEHHTRASPGFVLISKAGRQPGFYGNSCLRVMKRKTSSRRISRESRWVQPCSRACCRRDSSAEHRAGGWREPGQTLLLQRPILGQGSPHPCRGGGVFCFHTTQMK